MDQDEERSAQLRRALLTALGVLVVIGIAIALGTSIMVRTLGLNGDSTSGPVGAKPVSPAKRLPTTALPVPGRGKASSPAPQQGRVGLMHLNVSPVQAAPMERINLTGRYRGGDNVNLEVQRYENGVWTNFGVQATVRVGTFATYVMTGHTGENRFRMFDPAAKEESNVVMVTIR